MDGITTILWKNEWMNEAAWMETNETMGNENMECSKWMNADLLWIINYKIMWYKHLLSFYNFKI